jgi:hypothetical protein
MKKYLNFLIIYFSLFLLIFGQDGKDPLAVKYASEIKAADLSEYLHVIASDLMEGRETGREGQKKAAHYLAAKFREFGVEPGMKVQGKDSYFQEFKLIKKNGRKYILWQEAIRKNFLMIFMYT